MSEIGMKYASLRIFMEYLEANKRIDLVKRCPSLKCVDSVVPISLNYLYLSRTCTIINTVNYKIGIVRRYPKEGPKILKQYERINNDGGESYDLNEFGRRDRSGNEVLCPGDYIIETAHEPEIDRNIEEEDFYMEGRKRRLAYLRTLKRVEERQEEIERIEAKLFECIKFPLIFCFDIDKTSLITISCNEHPKYKTNSREIGRWRLWFEVRHSSGWRSSPTENKTEDEKKEFVKLMKAMINGKKEIGTCHPMEIGGQKIVKEVFDEIKKRHGVTFKREVYRGCTRLPFTFSLPIDDSSKLSIYCNRNEKLNKKDSKKKPWTLWIFVESIGDTMNEEYKKLLEKIVNDKRKVGKRFPLAIGTKYQVKQLLSEVKNLDGVTFKKLKKPG
ncbi:hypothetical protein CAEBREN_10349 [Caenorhabditis brenneri]|uniref:Uncharacterized protein n=1 Tax=Caenorhabditis brenneri TaxID=135651 RepID=G0MDW5_CAEBE|nr:hypothetical protein CAEBREN_10349 [Caenorhabditis brenneri]